jgi:NADH-quinone oxidoreductase subunit A
MVIYFFLTVALAGGMIVASYLLGPKKARARAEPYESGIVSTGSARLRLPVRFYLVAMLFVVFDLEAVFVFLWAVVVREAGWTGYAAMGIFLLILVAGLVYEGRQGVLDWTATGHRRQGG